jgi:hypothetical protein
MLSWSHGFVNGKRYFQKILVLAHWNGRIQAEHVSVIGVYYRLGKGNTSGSWEAERACISSSGAFKTYANIWKGRN